jgi:hypothetical protein
MASCVCNGDGLWVPILFRKYSNKRYKNTKKLVSRQDRNRLEVAQKTQKLN